MFLVTYKGGIGAENELQPEFGRMKDWAEAPHQHIIWYCSLMSMSRPKSSRFTKPQKTMNRIVFHYSSQTQRFRLWGNTTVCNLNIWWLRWGILVTLFKWQMIWSLDIPAFELIVWPSHYILRKIAYPLDGVGYIIWGFVSLWCWRIT